jgi:hypothetical protein
MEMLQQLSEFSADWESRFFLGAITRAMSGVNRRCFSGFRMSQNTPK